MSTFKKESLALWKHLEEVQDKEGLRLLDNLVVTGLTVLCQDCGQPITRLDDLSRIPIGAANPTYDKTYADCGDGSICKTLPYHNACWEARRKLLGYDKIYEEVESNA
jgi:hypothetical protein